MLCMEKVLKETLSGGRFQNTPSKRRRIMAAIRGRGARSTEQAFRMLLVRRKIRGWEMHPKGLPVKPDIFFAERKLAVFLDGCFWHGCFRCGHIPKANNAFWKLKIERTKARDRRDATRLRKAGIRVIRIWEHELTATRRNQRLQQVLRLIEAS